MTLTPEDCLAAEVAIHRTWLDHTDRALQKLINLRIPFSIDQLRAHVPPGVQPHHDNAWGAYIRAAERAGRIKHTGQYMASSRSTRHGGIVRLWIGGPSK